MTSEEKAACIVAMAEKSDELQRKRAQLTQQVTDYHDALQRAGRALAPWRNRRGEAQFSTVAHHDFSAIPEGKVIADALAELQETEHDLAALQERMRRFNLI